MKLEIKAEEAFKACFLKQERKVAYFSVDAILELLHDPIKAELLEEGEDPSDSLEDTVNMIAIEWFDLYIAPLRGENIEAKLVLISEKEER